jgi:hypothetical protein
VALRPWRELTSGIEQLGGHLFRQPSVSLPSFGVGFVAIAKPPRVDQLVILADDAIT